MIKTLLKSVIIGAKSKESKKVLCSIICLLSVVSCTWQSRKDHVSSFLADNWSMDVHSWEKWHFHYRGGKHGSYLASYETSDSSSRRILVIPVDSLVVRYCVEDRFYTASIKTLSQDSLWNHYYPEIDLATMAEKVRFVLYYDIESIDSRGSSIEITFFGESRNKPTPRLIKSAMPRYSDLSWRCIGDDWYIPLH